MMDSRDELIPLDRLSDRFFKYLFAVEEHKDLLIAFLNEVLLDIDPEGSARRIEDVRYKDRESLPLRHDAKLPRFDVIATSEDGRIFHVEVQIARDRHFLERSLYYTATTYFLQLGQGEEYGDLAPVIFVGLLDFQIFPSLSEGGNKGEDYHTLHRILNVRNHRWEMRGMEFHFLELPKLKSQLRRRRAAPRTGLERLLSYLGNVGGERAMQELAQVDPRVERMMQLESLFTKDPNLLRDYFFSRRDRVDYERARRDSFAEGKAEGEAKGRAEGEAKGRAEGEAKGRAEGRAEGRAAGMEETAAAMLREKIDILLVSRVTGLSLDRLEVLRTRAES